MAHFEELQEEIRLHEARIEEHATNLRRELEELAYLALQLWESDEKYRTPNGDHKSDGDIDYLAYQVGEIEEMFDKD